MTSRTFATRAIALDPEAERPGFDARFDRCRSMLYVIASRLLGTAEQAAEAVANCRATAARNLTDFTSEAAFGSWLARVLIDEALTIFRTRHRDQ